MIKSQIGENNMKSYYHKIFRIIFLIGIMFITYCCNEDSSNEPTTTKVEGVLTLPNSAEGKNYIVAIDNDLDGDNGFAYSTIGVCGSGTQVNYSINDVAIGTYYIYSAVCVVTDCSQGPQSGDYLGFYNGTPSNPPTSANATITSSNSETFDIILYIIP